VTTAITLVGIALLRAAFAGFRASAGRDGHLARRSYYAAAMLYGFIAGLVVAALVAFWIAETLGVADHPVVRHHRYVDAGDRMLWVVAPYAAVVVVALVARLVTSFEAANALALLVLGPLSFIRPWVVALGVVVAASWSSDGTVALAAVLAGLGALVVGPLVSLLYRTG